jgi:hypothetical protein
VRIGLLGMQLGTVVGSHVWEWPQVERDQPRTSSLLLGLSEKKEDFFIQHMFFP